MAYRHSRRRRGAHAAPPSTCASLVAARRLLATSPLLLPAVAVFSFATPASASNAQIVITGYGWGHGRGGGQYGAAGFAVLGQQTYQEILAHYFENTTLGTMSDRTVSVELQKNAFDNIYVYSPVSYSIAGVVVPAGSMTELALNGTSWSALVSNTTVGGCTTSLGWHTVASSLASSQAIIAPGVGTSLGAMEGENWNNSLVVCYSDGSTEHVDGYVEGITYQSGSLPLQRTVNVLPIDNYVEGVVPHETPASWGTVGAAGPQGQAWGFQALEVQAVEARSYAASGPGSWYGFADTCDSTTCQVYDGMWDPSSSSAPYYQLSDLAVTDTSHQVLFSSNGAIARTEYSASTGGYTAGGTFPAVSDPYDNICVPGICNTMHSWSTTISSSQIESAYPQIGTLSSIVVTGRNGYGAIGGRVESLNLYGSAGSVTVSGDSFASMLGLNSDWFEFSGPIPISNDAAASTTGAGYWISTDQGAVYAFGGAQSYGSMAGTRLNKPIVGMASTPDGKGYWLVASDGGIFSFGDAQFYGSMGGKPLNKPIVGMASTPDGKGYWLVASDGGIFSFGDAQFYGSMGGKPLNKPIVGMASTPDGKGYWLVASDGGIFSFGDAQFYGSMGGKPLNKPVVGMIASPTGKGYWLVASDGGIFTFGDAHFYGSLPGLAVNEAVAGASPTPDGGGYDELLANGQVVSFGDGSSSGDVTTMGAAPIGTPIAMVTPGAS